MPLPPSAAAAAPARTPRAQRQASAPGAGLLLVGFAAALGLRLAIAGPGPATSATGGLAFAACLAALCVTGRQRRSGRPAPREGHPARRLGSQVALGAGVGAALCLPVALRAGHLSDYPGLGSWLPVVAVVAVAEEAFLRGVLHDALTRRAGVTVAVAVGALAFGALHVPLYGWRAGALDTVVGLAFGCLRVATGGVAAPASAHLFADLGAWFLR